MLGSTETGSRRKARLATLYKVGALALFVPIVMAGGCPLSVTNTCPEGGQAGGSTIQVTVSVSGGQGTVTLSTTASAGIVTDGDGTTPSIVLPAQTQTVTVTTTGTDEAGTVETDTCDIEVEGVDECTEDDQCDNSDACDGAETCDPSDANADDFGCVDGTAVTCDEGFTCDSGDGSCNCDDNDSCDDGDPCNGAETCNDDGDCEDGTAVVCEDDGDNCTTEVCNSETGECDTTDVECNEGFTCNPDDGSCDCDDDPACDDGQFCTGDETCGADGDCSSAGDPCADDPDALVCDEENEACVECLADGDCDTEAGETCDLDTNTCEGVDVVCETNADCETDEVCSDGVCVAGCDEDADCNDGLFCNGIETCDTTTNACVDGTEPCAEGQTCEEGATGATCVGIEFTLDQDNLTGTTGNDAFDAPLAFNAQSGTQIATLQTGDTANGLAGTDTLDATINATGGVTITPTLIDIENQNYTAFVATTINAANISGVDKITSTGSTANLTINGLAELTDLGLSSINNEAVDLTLIYSTSSVTSGSSDTVGIDLSTAVAGSVIIQTPASVSNGIETAKFTSNSDNSLVELTQTNGTSMTKATFAGSGSLQVKDLPDTIRTFDASSMTAPLTLGQGTRADGTDNYSDFHGGTNVDIASITGGSGDDLFVFNTTLNTSDADQTGEAIDGGAGTDVAQATLNSALGSFTNPLKSIEEYRLNATAASSSISFLGFTGINTLTIEADDSAHTFTVDQVPVSSGSTWPALAFRGDGTQTAQTYDTVTYQPSSATGSSDILAVTFANRGTALNATGTTNAHNIASLTLGTTSSGFENVSIGATDGPLSVSGTTTINPNSGNAISLTVTGSSNVTFTTLTSDADRFTTVNANGVSGNFTAVINAMNGGTISLGSGNDSVDCTGSAASAIVINGGSGNDTLTGAAGADNITGAAGTDTLNGGDGADTLSGGDDNDTIQPDLAAGTAAADTVSTGNGSDTIILTENDASSANADTISDFSPGTGGDKFALDLSAMETSGSTDGDEVVNFIKFAAGGDVADSDAVVISEISAGSTPGATVNVLVVTTSIASTAALETALEVGGSLVLVVNAADANVTNCFPVVYADGTDAFLAVCFAETETDDDTDYEGGDLTCFNYAKMSGNTAIAAGEFVAANFDFVP